MFTTPSEFEAWDASHNVTTGVGPADSPAAIVSTLVFTGRNTGLITRSPGSRLIALVRDVDLIMPTLFWKSAWELCDSKGLSSMEEESWSVLGQDRVSESWVLNWFKSSLLSHVSRSKLAELVDEELLMVLCPNSVEADVSKVEAFEVGLLEAESMTDMVKVRIVSTPPLFFNWLTKHVKLSTKYFLSFFILLHTNTNPTHTRRLRSQSKPIFQELQNAVNQKLYIKGQAYQHKIKIMDGLSSHHISWYLWDFLHFCYTNSMKPNVFCKHPLEAWCIRKFIVIFSSKLGLPPNQWDRCMTGHDLVHVQKISIHPSWNLWPMGRTSNRQL